jgi:hypothetical protein
MPLCQPNQEPFAAFLSLALVCHQISFRPSPPPHTHIPTPPTPAAEPSRDEGANLPKHSHLPDLGLQGAAAWHWRACVLQRCN